MNEATAASTFIDEPAVSPILDRDWLAVAAAMVGLIFSTGTLTIYSFGVFVRPLQAEFGWTGTALSGALAVSQIGMAIVSPLWGQLIDRIGPRGIILASVTTLSLIVASASMLATPIWHLYLLFAAFPLLAAGASPLGYSAVLVRLFDRHLGLALGLSAMGVGLGATVLPPLAQVLIENVGWRDAYLAIGIATFLTTLPAALVCTRNVRGSIGGEGPVAPVLPFIWTDAFATMCSIYFLLGVVTVGTIAQLVPILVDRGFTATSAAHVAAVTGLAALVGRAGIGVVLDRMHARRVVAAVAFLTACSLFLLVSGGGDGRILAAVMLLGVSVGAEVNFIAYLTKRHFPASAFGRLYGIGFGSYLVGCGVGPLLVGVSADRFGGYTPALALFAAFAVITIPLALSLPRSQPPQSTD